MRAICESCSKPQPIDWRGGDHCVWCGNAVRAEVRCFWCANWTPAVKFCRTCGAGTVDSKQYPAARMLKDAGCDRFSVPRQLGELEPDQIDNFTRIYQEHAVVAAHHVGQVEWLESFLVRKAWSEELDDLLTKELPWPLEQLAKMRAAAQLVTHELEGAEKARAIGEATPFVRTERLSVIARVALEDWTAMPSAEALVGNPDEAMRTEATLALSHWRTLFGPGLASSCRRYVVDELRRCKLREEASVRLALLGEPTGDPLPTGDFATALATNDVDSLCAAAIEPGEVSRRSAAAQRLLQLGILTPVATVLRTLPADRQLELMRLIDRRRKPIPELREVLFEFAEKEPLSEIGQYACYLLCYGCPAHETLRVARAARGDLKVYQALMQKAALPPSAVDEFGEFLLRQSKFSIRLFGIADLAKEGRMPADFVPRHWRDVSSEVRLELCQFAEAQLAAYGDEALHRFLVDVAFTPGDVKVQSQAWSGLYRWYNSFGYPRRRPVTVSGESIERFFGSAKRFLMRLAQFLDDRAILHESLQRDEIAQFLSYPDWSALAGISGAKREAVGLAEAVAGVMRDTTIDFTLRLACTDFLGFLGTADGLGKTCAKLLTSFLRTDLDLQAKRALDRMANGPGWGNPPSPQEENCDLPQ